MTLATLVIPVSWLRISGAIYLLPPYDFRALTGAILLLSFSPGINAEAELKWLNHEPECGTRKHSL
jgi:hypothetical protein